MTTKIKQKITGYGVVTPAEKLAAAAVADSAPAAPPTAQVIQMHESLERPETLLGVTFKIKSPLFEHALYVTLNDIVLNAGTPNEQRRPFEIFINSKNMDHFQWIVALTRVMSAVFRKGGDIAFIAEEMKAVFDPRGGYFKAGGVYMPSIVAEIGAVLEQHLTDIGMMKGPELDEGRRQLMAEKRAAYEAAGASAEASTPGTAEATAVVAPAASNFPAGSQLCGKCNTLAMVLMDNCQTCLNCGYSKCG